QMLKASAIGCRGAGVAQILIDDDDSVGIPAQGQGTFAQRVLPRRAFGILEHLLERALAYIQTGEALKMAQCKLLPDHGSTSWCAASQSLSRRTSACRSVSRRIARDAARRTNGSGGARSVQAVGRERTWPVMGS